MQSYTVREGDSLWKLAGQFLGEPTRWPEIYSFNNEPDVVERTGSRIADPNLILIGQVLAIPEHGYRPDPKAPDDKGQTLITDDRGQVRQVPSAKPKPVDFDSPSAKPKIRSIPFEFKLEDLPKVKSVTPAYTLTLKMTGSVTLQSEKVFDFAKVSQKGFEIEAKQEAEHALGKLVSGVKFEWEGQGMPKLEMGITSFSTRPQAPSTTFSTGVSILGMPTAKASVKYPPIRGKVGHHVYLTNEFGIELELEPHDSRRLAPIPVPVPSAKPLPLAPPEPEPTNWNRVIGTGLLIGAGVLIVATIVEDIVTLGAGVADDPASFAAASAMIGRGLQLYRTVPGIAPVVIQGAH